MSNALLEIIMPARRAGIGRRRRARDLGPVLLSASWQIMDEFMTAVSPWITPRTRSAHRRTRSKVVAVRNRLHTLLLLILDRPRGAPPTATDWGKLSALARPFGATAAASAIGVAILAALTATEVVRWLLYAELISRPVIVTDAPISHLFITIRNAALMPRISARLLRHIEAKPLSEPAFD